MKKKILTGLIGSFLALTIGASFAQPAPPPPGHGPGPHGVPPPAKRQAYRIQHRIDAQEREIRHGQRKGTLNKREARTLRDNLAHIKRQYERAKRTDRYVSMEERARLDRMLDRNERMIRRMENNAITRYDRW